LAIPHGPVDQGDHTDLTLHGRRARVVRSPGLYAGDQALGGAQHDAVLPERGQDLLDVAEEHAVGPDAEEALALERDAVGVEQIGGAVEGYRGRPGTARAPDDDAAARRGPDAPV